MTTRSVSKMIPLDFPMSENVGKMMDQIREYFWTFEESLTSVKKQATWTFIDTVYRENPKLSGYSSANWRVAVSEEPDNTLPDRVREIMGRVYDSKGNSQPNVLLTYTELLEDPKWKIDNIRYNSYVEVYNFVPYIYEINDTSSRPGFFEFAVNATIKYIESKIL
ncbi:MAG: hypothetical protein WCS33_01320 [Candidatus Caldatribacteriota bacterium]